MANGKKKFYKKWWFWLIIVVVIAAGAYGGKGNEQAKSEGSTKPGETQEQKTDDKKDSAVKKETAKEDTKVTYENFLKVNMDSKYEDVFAILGEGKELTSSEVGGVKSVIYTWNGTGISNVTITIQNDVVSGKAQAGLGSKDAGITLEKYNQVTDGMSYDEVKEILGEGQITSQTKIMDVECLMYTWMNKDGSNANLTFSSDKLGVKAQFNLK